MTHAATASAAPAKPHTMHSKRACDARFARSTCPQARHVCDVYRGSTSTTGTPTLAALYRGCNAATASTNAQAAAVLWPDYRYASPSLWTFTRLVLPACPTGTPVVRITVSTYSAAPEPATASSAVPISPSA